MDSQLLYLLPTEQARCREIARDYTTMGSIGCFAAAMIEQALQRADRAIIDGGEDSIRGVLRELQTFARTGQPSPARPCFVHQPGSGMPRAAIPLPPGGLRAGPVSLAAAAS